MDTDEQGAPDPTVGLMGRLHDLTPAAVPTVVHQVAREAGCREAVLYLVDYEQTALRPLPGQDVPEREPLTIDQTFAGRAFRDIEVLTTDLPDGSVRVWLPLLSGSTRIGMMEAVTERFDETARARLNAFGAAVALTLTATNQHTDTFALARRSRSLVLAAEMQWSLLPPLTFSNGKVTVSGVLEPSYLIAGDAFDYALNARTAHLIVLDAMGHGFGAAVMASVAINVYRHSRRHGDDLAETYRAMNEAIGSQFGSDRFATAQLAQVDIATGRLRWLNAGHPPPLLIRGTNVVGPIECPPSLPIGLGHQVTEIGELSLEPGDRLVFLSDGVLEARSATGEFFGEGPLPEFLSRAMATGLAAPEILRRLARAIVDHHADGLQDDATVVLVEWGGRS